MLPMICDATPRSMQCMTSTTTHSCGKPSILKIRAGAAPQRSAKYCAWSRSVPLHSAHCLKSCQGLWEVSARHIQHMFNAPFHCGKPKHWQYHCQSPRICMAMPLQSSAKAWPDFCNLLPDSGSPKWSHLGCFPDASAFSDQAKTSQIAFNVSPFCSSWSFLMTVIKCLVCPLLPWTSNGFHVKARADLCLDMAPASP